MEAQRNSQAIFLSHTLLKQNFCFCCGVEFRDYAQLSSCLSLSSAARYNSVLGTKNVGVKSQVISRNQPCQDSITTFPLNYKDFIPCVFQFNSSEEKNMWWYPANIQHFLLEGLDNQIKFIKTINFHHFTKCLLKICCECSRPCSRWWECNVNRSACFLRSGSSWAVWDCRLSSGNPTG